LNPLDFVIIPEAYKKAVLGRVTGDGEVEAKKLSLSPLPTTPTIPN